MKNPVQYEKKHPHTEAFIDYSCSGALYASDSKDQEMVGAASITLKVMKQLTRFLGNIIINEGTLGGLPISNSEETAEKYFRFYLEIGSERIFFWLANEGARGCYLNSSWNPTRVLTGQNVFKPTASEEYTLAGLKFKMRPCDVVEFPFRLFIKVMDQQTGTKSWPGRSSMSVHLKDGEISWRRLDLTTYTGPFEKGEAQKCLSVVEFMASSKSVVGFDMTDLRKTVELSLRSFANAKFESYKKTKKVGIDDEMQHTETVVFVKCRSKNDDQQLYRLSIYDKVREVMVNTSNPGNKIVLKDKEVREDISSRLRIELQLTPTAFQRTSSLNKIAMRGSEERSGVVLESKFWNRTKFLRLAFPSIEVFSRKKHELIVAALRDLHLDWILFPRNPHSLMKKAESCPEDPVSIVLFKWKEKKSVPLLGKSSAHKTTFPHLSRNDLNAAYATLKRVGVEVDRISYTEAVHLWDTLVNAVIPEEDYLALAEARERMSDTENLLTSKQRSRILDFQQRVFSEASKNAMEIRKTAARQLHSSTVEKNLLGNDHE